MTHATRSSREKWNDRLWTCGVLGGLVLIFACCCGFFALLGMLSDSPSAREEHPVLSWIVLTAAIGILMGVAVFSAFLYGYEYWPNFWDRIRGRAKFRWTDLLLDLLISPFTVGPILLALALLYVLVRQFV